MFITNLQAAQERQEVDRSICLGLDESGYLCSPVALRPEEIETFKHFREELAEVIRPDGVLQMHYYQQVLQAQWNLQRLFAEETWLLACSPNLFEENEDTRRLERLARHKRQLEISHLRGLRQLRQLQKREQEPEAAAAAADCG
ncbi:MAG: hypothetical protein M9913_06980 [Bryobacteraceae bacterium]|nr:hypothetical protein [Solibacteraceae bacterium]MCL4843778.1 hypothetical protein [Bryobacteraceae bacterium]MCO5350626.1 hypothetical protein [Bryobacteraceae bacterium]